MFKNALGWDMHFLFHASFLYAFDLMIIDQCVHACARHPKYSFLVPHCIQHWCYFHLWQLILLLKNFHIHGTCTGNCSWSLIFFFFADVWICHKLLSIQLLIGIDIVLIVVVFLIAAITSFVQVTSVFFFWWGVIFSLPWLNRKGLNFQNFFSHIGYNITTQPQLYTSGPLTTYILADNLVLSVFLLFH